MQKENTKTSGQHVYWLVGFPLDNDEDYKKFHVLYRELDQFCMQLYFNVYNVVNNKFKISGIIHSIVRKRVGYFTDKGFTATYFTKDEWNYYLDKLRGSDKINQIMSTELKMERYKKGIKPVIAVKDLYLECEPHPWQIKLIEIFNNPPALRKLYWFWETQGAAGKTLFAKHICLTKNALLLGGGIKDIKHGVASWILQKGSLEIGMFDLCRTQEEYISYQGLEDIKDGCFFSPKYDSQMILFDSPHVIVFANFPPEIWKTSMDRWVIHSILGEDEFHYYAKEAEKIRKLFNPQAIPDYRYPDSANNKLRYFDLAMDMWQMYNEKYRIDFKLYPINEKHRNDKSKELQNIQEGTEVVCDDDDDDVFVIDFDAIEDL